MKRYCPKIKPTKFKKWVLLVLSFFFTTMSDKNYTLKMLQVFYRKSCFLAFISEL